MARARGIRSAVRELCLAFPRVEELQPGQTLTFTVEVDAVQPGDARFRAEVRAAHLKTPLKEEQAARVTGR